MAEDGCGEHRLSYANFLQAVTPYCYLPFFSIEQTEEYLKKYSPKVISRVDVHHDGQISFTEFFFFLVLL